MLIIYLWKGKGHRVQDRGKCHYLLSRSVQRGALPGVAGVGGHTILPQVRQWGGKALPGRSCGGHGQGRRGPGGVKAVSSESSGDSDPRLRIAAWGGALPGASFSLTLVQTGVGVLVAMTLAWVGLVATWMGPEGADWRDDSSWGLGWGGETTCWMG